MYNSLNEIDVALRVQMIVLYAILDDIKKILKQSPTISRRLVKYLLYTYYHIINQSGYGDKFQKNELMKVLHQYENELLKFFQFEEKVVDDIPDQLPFECEVIERVDLLLYIINQNPDQPIDRELKELQPFFEHMIQSTSHGKWISKKLVFSLFNLYRALFYRTGYAEQPEIYSLKVDENISEHFKTKLRDFFATSRYIEDIIGKGIRF